MKTTAETGEEGEDEGEVENLRRPELRNTPSVFCRIGEISIRVWTTSVPDSSYQERTHRDEYKT
ncbi:hypothetical protein ACFQL0_19880 [Haloplanus litoreus]